MAELKELNDLSLQELRKLYPNVKARCKRVMLEKIAKELEVVAAEQVEAKDINEELDLESPVLDWKTVNDYILAKAESYDKILIQCETSIAADALFRQLNTEVFPQLNKRGLLLMANSNRRDFHINGTCYVRLVCRTNYDLVKKLTRFTEFKDLV